MKRQTRSQSVIQQLQPPPKTRSKNAGGRAAMHRTDESVVQAKDIQTVQPQPEIKKRGRPRKQKSPDENASEANTSARNFAEHWNSIEKLYNELTDSGYESINIGNDTLGSICKWSAKEGLGDNQFKVIWTLVSDKRTLDEEQKITLVNSLIPKEKWHEDNISAVLKWLFKGSKNVGANLINNVLKMLYGWTIYDLVDPKLFSNPVTYNKFVYLCKERVEILPWLSIFVRKITTSMVITKGNINLLYAITGKMINDTTTNCATEILHYFQYLRPDLFPCDASYVKWVRRNFNDEPLNLNIALRSALYGAKKRISREAIADVTEVFDDDGIKRQSIETVLKANQQFFEEFAPLTTVDVNVNSLQLLNRAEAMLIMLRKEETLPLVAFDKETLEQFNIWATMLFIHRFAHYQPEDNEKCVFVLDRCLQLSMCLNDSLPAVTEWLIKFLPSWDGKLFEKQIRELLRFMPLHIFAAKCGSFFKKLKMDFVRGSSLIRLHIWDILDSIIVRWPEAVKGNHSITEVHLDDETKEDVKKFFLEILSLLRKFVSAGGHQDTLVLRVIIETFQKIIEAYSDEMIPIKPAVPEELAQMMILCDRIEILESCTKLYVTLCSIQKRMQHSESLGFKREMCLYFGRKGDAVPLMSLFRAEYEALDRKETLLGESEVGILKVKEIMGKLTCFYSDALREFRADPTQPFPIDFAEDVFLWKELKKRAPFVYRQVGHHRPPSIVNIPRRRVEQSEQ